VLPVTVYTNGILGTLAKSVTNPEGTKKVLLSSLL